MYQHLQSSWTAAGAAAAVEAVVAEGHPGNTSASRSCHGIVAGGGVGAEGAVWAGRDQSPPLPCTSRHS